MCIRDRCRASACCVRVGFQRAAARFGTCLQAVCNTYRSDAMSTHPIVRFFSSDPRFDGVRPVQAWGLRLFFLLMLVFVAPYAWRVLLTHEGPWDPVRAVTFAVWATY